MARTREGGAAMSVEEVMIVIFLEGLDERERYSLVLRIPIFRVGSLQMECESYRMS